ncbi:hypothetical protein BDZ97DRAFT_1920738 [Flammula alnicola]|nr:hypothetical protein BDZ97DRAFT_1921911 [Flammula alnicola]KAF8962061.1 hypothetical protein BDZ97DRAFT_1920738 [Flammula alnicola]
MHPALLHQEIFVEILGHLWTEDDLKFPVESLRKAEHYRKALHATLLNVALTCRAFNKAALDQLWRNIDKMSHLLRLLSAFKLVCKDNQYKYTLDGPIPDSEWTLLDKYARRVRTLVYCSEPDVEQSAFFRVVQRTNKPFFPLLRNLCTIGYGSEVKLLVSSSLLRVHAIPGPLCGQQNHPFMWSLFESLVEKAPDMQYLYIGYRVPERPLDCIARLKNLRHLGMSQVSKGLRKTRLDSTFFAKLANMEHLSSLNFDGLMSSRNELRRPAFGDFCSLTMITITSTVQQVVPLLQSGTFYALESFILTFTLDDKSPQRVKADFEEASWHTFFHTLHQNTGQRFKELTLGYSMPDMNDLLDQDTYDGRYSHIHPLTAAISAPIYPDLLELNLTKVNITYAAFWSLSSAHMRGFIKAWLDIEELRIFTPNVGTIDFCALIDVAENLPRLRSLLLSFQVENLPDLDTIPSLSHCLVSLDVWISLISGPAPMSFARSLLKLFPTLRDLQYSGHGPCAAFWRRAGALIPFVQEMARRNQNQNT